MGILGRRAVAVAVAAATVLGWPGTARAEPRMSRRSSPGAPSRRC
ncbi:hypothetical protein AB0J72_28390 [Dactylosporangium sp. NPDC049742]